jgi:hypothetical protein
LPAPSAAIWQFRAAREPIECLAHLVRRRNHEVNIAPVEEIKLMDSSPAALTARHTP